MDINLAIDNVINYIEENICNNIDYEKAAQMVGVSVFHFQRMFSFLTGVSLAEYIRRRKMTLAAFDLQNTNNKIVDIAQKYGYATQSSFTRTFQQFHGITPSVAREEGVCIQAYPKINLHITVKGIENIKFRIEKTEPYKVFGKGDIIIPMEHKYSLDFILNYGENVIRNGSHDATNIAAGFPVGERYPFHLLHGIYFKNKDDTTHFMYGWELPKKGVDECFTIVDIPKTKWAVFTYYGKHVEGLPKIWTYLYTDWLLTSGYKTEDHIIIEKEMLPYDKHESCCSEVWLPIK